jgi:Fe-S cluster assembly protein SufD
MSAVVDFPVKSEAQPYLEAARLDAGEPEWLAQQRRRALARFAELGFPSRRGEAWRYLDLRPLEQAPLLPAGAAGTAAGTAVANLGFSGAAHRLALVDGRFAPELSQLAGLPAGVWFGSTRAAIGLRPDLVGATLAALADERDQPFAALNAGVFVDGFVLAVPEDVVLDAPIEILHLASGDAPASFHTRSLVSLGARSRARLLETYAGPWDRPEAAVGAGPRRYWRNDVVALELAGGAALDRVALVEEADMAVHFAVLAATLGPAARLTSVALLLRGGVLRHDAVVRCDGERTRCGLYGAFVAAARQQVNLVTAVDHRAESGETREVVQGVASGRAHGAFQGRITVRPGAQKVDAHMLSRNLLLGAHAAIDTKPELEIFADDVKCGHGAAVGDLDEAALFYLLARGIPAAAAKHMLIKAFVREVAELAEAGPVRQHLLARLAARLADLEEWS